MSENQALELIEKQEWMEPVADEVQNAVGSAFDSEAGRKVKNFLHGTWLGHPLHSALTDVPVGAWTSALVMDALEDVSGRGEFGQAADAAVAIGLVGAVAAAAAGVTDWQATDGRARKVGLAHGLLNLTGTLLYTGSWALRKKGSRAAGKGLSALGFLAAMGGAYLGGKLVYSERIGVDHTAGQEFPENFTDVLAESELGEGEMRRVDIQGSRVLVARSEGRIHAISEVCSHLGGPLAEGELKDCAVTCPWHGSRFSLEDGRVLDGPATHPARCLETQVSNGRILVKSRD